MNYNTEIIKHILLRSWDFDY